MITRIFAFRLMALMVLMTMMQAAPLHASSPSDEQNYQAVSADSSTQAVDFKGTWSGTFFSKRGNSAAFTMTVIIDADAQGHLTSKASLNTECLKDLQLEVTVTGSTLVLSGSDEDGNNITVRGTVDKTGTMLKAKYILNGSATGKCEADTGTGDLAKR